MMQGMMNCCGGMWGMAATGALVLVILVLGAAALAKYILDGR